MGVPWDVPIICQFDLVRDCLPEAVQLSRPLRVIVHALDGLDRTLTLNDFSSLLQPPLSSVQLAYMLP